MSIRINREKIKTYAVSILLPLILGAVVGLLTSGSTRYNDLVQPALAPPAILFPIVWSILYALMGYAHGSIKWNNMDTPDTERVYYAQLIVNLLWPIFFFLLQWRLFAFIWILLLDVLVITMTIRFYSRIRSAGLLQIPYCIWVLFATYLNLATYLLNR